MSDLGPVTERRFAEAFAAGAVITAKAAAELIGPDATPYAVKRRLRCSACAEVGHVEVWI